MKAVLSIVWGLAVWAPSWTWAADLTVDRKGDHIDANLSGLAFPAGFPKDLKSGLNSRLQIHLELLGNSVGERQAEVRIDVRYDLWDEVFAMTETLGSAVRRKEDFKTLDQALEFFAHIPLTDLFPVSSVASSKTYQLRAEVLLNPIEQERLESLKKWVAENEASVRQGGSVSTVPLGGAKEIAPPAAPAPNSVFSRIFQGYAGMGATATWRQTVVSRPFTLKDLAHD